MAMRLLTSRYFIPAGMLAVTTLAGITRARPRLVLFGMLVVLLVYAVPKSIRDYRAWRGR
jgi:hypothetical protein